MRKILLWMIMTLTAIQGMAQSVTFTPSVLVTENVAVGARIYELNTTNTPSVPDIKINLSGFSCGTLTYDWETVSFIPAGVVVGSPSFRAPSDNPINSLNPEPYEDDAESRVQYRILGPGVYVIRLCVSSCNGSEMSCNEVKIIARPLENVLPQIELEDIPELTLPIDFFSELDATVEDGTDQHAFYWTQSASNPMLLDLPIPGDGDGNPINVPRGSSSTLSQLNVSNIYKIGTYCFTVKAIDERGGENEKTECFFVKPAVSNFAINFYPIPSMILSSMTIPISAKITGINQYNDKIRYTWLQLAGPQAITLPSSAYMGTNFNSTFDVPPLWLSNLYYGTYTLRLRVEDEYYPGTYTDQDITVTVNPHESNLSVSIFPDETSIFKVPNEGFLFAGSQSPDATKPFVVAGRVSGVHTYSGAVATYWLLKPEQIDETDPDNLIYPVFTNFQFTNFPLNSVTSNTDTLAFRYNEIKTGTYVFRYIAKDNFYGTEVSASTRIHIEKLVLRGAMIEANPNPANNEIYLVFINDAKQKIEVQILDLMGKNMLSQELPLGKGERKLVLDTHQLPNGFYILKVKSNLRDNITKKIVIRHD